MTEVGVASGIGGELGFVNKFQMILRCSPAYNHCSAPSVESETRSVVSNSLQSHGLQPTRFPLSMEFSRQEYWSGLPCPPGEDLPNLGSKPSSPTLQADSLLLSHQRSYIYIYVCMYYNMIPCCVS